MWCIKWLVWGKKIKINSVSQATFWKTDEAGRFLFFIIPRHLKSGGYYGLPPVQNFALSVRPSVSPTICPSPFRFHSLTRVFFDGFSSTLYNSWYWGGVVWDCRWVILVKQARVIALDLWWKLVSMLYLGHVWPILFKLCIWVDIWEEWFGNVDG